MTFASMTRQKLAGLAVLPLLFAGGGDARSAEQSPAVASTPAIRRLSPEQYRRTIDDIFGAGIAVGTRFEPDVRVSGLLEVGLAQTTVTSSGFEQYDAAARVIASQVMASGYRDAIVPCKPTKALGVDEACARGFIGELGRFLYRRPLSKTETTSLIAVALDSSAGQNDPYAGLEQTLATMLVSPQFLFRIETTERDPKTRRAQRFDGYSKASRLSFLLWNSTPDDALLRAAASGELHTDKGLARQVERMLASPRLEGGVRAFFTDMLGFNEFDTANKDSTIYPQFTPKASRDAQEQTLKTIVDLLLVQDGDYRDLFVTRKTFLTQTLGTIYGVPVTDNRPNGAPEQWIAYEYPAGDPRAGVLSQASFVSLHSHPGRTSPTLRGKALREIFLCQKVPGPPGNVDFTLINRLSDEGFKTARDRLKAHASEGMCAGCHKITDPIGLSLESFDGAGAYRTTENGVAIDTVGDLNGRNFSNVSELGALLRDDPAIPSCFATKIYSYALGRPVAGGDRPTVTALTSGFAESGYRVRALLKKMAEDEAFYTVSSSR